MALAYLNISIAALHLNLGAGGGAAVAASAAAISIMRKYRHGSWQHHRLASAGGSVMASCGSSQRRAQPAISSLCLRAASKRIFAGRSSSSTARNTAALQ